LNRELEQIRQQREDRRQLRNARGLPVISIVGYTNAGKSTLLNSLTRSHVAVEDGSLKPWIRAAAGSGSPEKEM